MPPSPFAPSDGALYVSVPLTNFSIAHIQSPNNFVAGRVAPSIPVRKQSDRYVRYPKGAFFRAQMRKRAKGTRAQVSNYEVDNTPSYFADTWALAKPIADEDRVNQDAPINLDRDTTIFLTQQGLLAREIEWVNTFFKTGVWSFQKTGVASAPGANQFLHFTDAASDPTVLFKAWRREFQEQNGFSPNQLTLGPRVYDALTEHPDIIDRIKYGQTPGSPAMVNRRTLAALLEFDEVLVAEAVQNTAAEGAPDAFSHIAGKGALLTYNPPTPGLLTPMACATFAWTGFLPNQGPNLGEVISRWRDGPARTDYLQADMAWDMKVVAADLGMFLSACVP